MMPFNDNGNLKQFQLIKFIHENSDDPHIITKISIVLRRDKIEAPYYMNTKIKLSTCLDNEENGLIHAMNVLNHNRMHNLTEDAYREIESLLTDAFDSDECEGVKLIQNDERVKMVLTSKSSEETRNLFERCKELFERIDNLVD